jgi:hypothetical protein
MVSDNAEAPLVHKRSRHDVGQRVRLSDNTHWEVVKHPKGASGRGQRRTFSYNTPYTKY